MSGCRHKWREIDREFIPATHKSPRQPINMNNLFTNTCVDKTMIICKCVKCDEQKILERPGDLRRNAEEQSGSKIWKRHT